MRPRVRYKILAVLVVVLSLVNLCGAVFVYTRLRKPLITNVTVQEVQPIDPALLAALTNTPRTVVAPVHGSDVSVDDAAVFVPVPRCVGRYRWRWSSVHDVPFATINGRTLAVGSSTAWGRVVQVWPERIVFDDGNYIENINNQEGVNNGNSTVSS